MPRVSSFAAPLSIAAVLAMATAPISATELQPVSRAAPYASSGVLGDGPVTADGWRRHRHRDGIDAGDVLAGVLIVGGIAAIASAASNSQRNRDYRDDRYRNDYRYRSDEDSYRYRRGDNRYTAGSGIDNAVDMCIGAIERDVRVDSVDSVDRDASGWLVTGTIYNGDGFSCRIDGSGRIDGISFGRGASASYSGAVGDGQWDDERYRQAWARVDASGQAPAPSASEPQPAYPGGPIDGDLPQD